MVLTERSSSSLCCILIDVAALLPEMNKPPSVPNCTMIASLGVPKRVPRKPTLKPMKWAAKGLLAKSWRRYSPHPPQK